MLEKQCIQARGFRNTFKDGEAVGFQMDVRSLYYRGLWLSQIRSMTLSVDGVEYDAGKVRWRLAGVTYTMDEMARESGVHWGVTEPATLLVDKPGGLESGYHHVKFGFRFSSSYLPPFLDEVLSYPDHERDLILV